MIVNGGYDSGGGRCGCCCSYSAEGYASAEASGMNWGQAGSCGASCASGDSANMNANLSTAINRAGD